MSELKRRSSGRRACTRARIRELRSLSVGAALPDQTLRRLDGNSGELTVPAGIELVRQGAPGRQVLILLTGCAVVTVDGSPVAQVTSGELIGELSQVSRMPACATVVALTPLRLLVLDPRQFADLMDDPAFAAWVAVTLSRRFPQLALPRHAGGPDSTRLPVPCHR